MEAHLGPRVCLAVCQPVCARRARAHTDDKCDRALNFALGGDLKRLDDN